MLFLAQTVLDAALSTTGAIDFDVREALDALIRTYRTLQSGIYYETLPTNPMAANICRMVQGELAEFRKQESERSGMTQTRDADVLGVLVFLQRLELDNNNGRKRGRAYLDFLRNFFPERPVESPASSSLIVP